ncbi:MAG: hypothetical protein ABL957_06350 [Parvularculaceae bacterium]
MSDLRSAENYSVYAIEHGLSAEERATARRLLNSHLESARRADSAHWLVWIAAAAEVGYGYDGAEYWDSFADAFPSWPHFGSRNQIRDWYKRFAAEYRSIAPSGRWAKQFPIIAWPITQAILPRYLQRHFSDHLYELRHTLARSGELTLDEIGDLLSDRYYGNSARFEGFLQQKTLTARIVMAVGLEQVADAVAPIERETLGRIVLDIERIGHSGNRLRETRRVLRDARFVNSHKPGFIARPRDHTQAAPVTRKDQPRLLARPLEEGRWSLSIAVPDLATPLRQAGFSPRDFEQARTRFRPKGKGDSWTPGRALFSYTGQSEESLPAYAATSVPIFEFENLKKEAHAAIGELVTFAGDSLKLLKVQADGAAFEIAGRHVRAAQQYLLAAANALSSELVQKLALSLQQTSTASVHLWLLNVPKRLEADQIAALKSLGLGYVLSARVEPLGLVPRWSAATGALLFLDSETPMFRITADLAVREFLILIDGAPVRVQPADGRSTLISVGPLAAGRHTMTVRALGAATGGDLAAEDTLIEIRPSMPWQTAIAGKAGIAFATDPRECSLDELFDRAASIRLRAPPGRTIKLAARFYGADGLIFEEDQLGKYNTPIPDEKLTEHVVHQLTANVKADRLDRAARIDLLVSLDEFGSEAISFDKDSEPLRWVRIDDHTVKLADDSDAEVPPTVQHFALDAIDIPQSVEYESALKGVPLPGKGALFVAKHQNHFYQAVATALPRQVSDFADLAIPAQVSSNATKPKALINALKRWRGARRLMGPMAFIARRNALTALERRLEALLCGEDWKRDAEQVRARNSDLTELYARVYYSRGFAAGLRAYDWRYDAERAAAEAEFIRLAKVYLSKDCPAAADDGLCRLALKAAFQPSRIGKADLPGGRELDSLKAASPLILGAYFARLAADLRPIQAVTEAA